MTFRNVYKTIIILLTLCLLVSCTENAPPYVEQGAKAPTTSEGEVRPTLYYQEQMYELRHWDGNKIDVSGMSLECLGIMSYAGGKLLADLDTTQAANAGESVYIDPEHPEKLIYQCHICQEYYSLTTEYDSSDHPEKTECDPKQPSEDGLPAPGVYYRGEWHSLLNDDVEKIDIAGRELKYIGVLRSTRLVYRNAELDTMSAQELAGSSVYTDPAQPDILIYHDVASDAYFAIDLK